MFDWLFPRLSLSTFEQAWVERRMRWLAAQFGLGPLRDCEVILPTETFFPDWNRQDQDPDQLMHQFGRWLHLDTTRLRLEVLPDDDMPAAAGLYLGDEKVICIRESQLIIPEWTVTTLAHELAHELLLGQGRLTERHSDHEWVTDLLPVFFGLGIFSANCTVNDKSWNYGGWEFWQIQRQGYLGSHVFGYALAVFSFWREESQPSWAAWLRPDARRPFQAGLRHLQKHGDEAISGTTESSTLADILDRLHDESPCVQLDAIWELTDRNEHPGDALESISGLMQSSDPDVARYAIQSIGNWPEPLPDGVQSQLLEAAADRRIHRQTAALAAAAKHGLVENSYADRLMSILREHRDNQITLVALEAAADAGRAVEQALPDILAIWKRAIAGPAMNLCDAAAYAVLAVSDSADDVVTDYFRDPDVRRLARETLREVQKTEQISPLGFI